MNQFNNDGNSHWRNIIINKSSMIKNHRIEIEINDGILKKKKQHKITKIYKTYETKNLIELNLYCDIFI